MYVQIYSADVSCLEDKRLFDALYSSMPSYRRENIDKLRFEKNKRLSLGAGVLLAKALSDRGLPMPVDICCGKYGKPGFSELDDIKFNLSHSGEIAMCAVSDCEVGCDVEKISAPNFGIAKRFFSSEENDHIDSFISEKERISAFYLLWTLKESYLKATGLGFSVSSSSFSVIDSGKIAVKNGIFPGKWSLCPVSIDPGYAASVCVCGTLKPSDIHITQVDFNDIC